MPTGTLAVTLRPKTFSEVIGHKKVIEAIQKQLASERQPIVWLLIGPTGIGKTTIAYLIASSIQNNSTEILEINAADLNGVDDARALTERSKYGAFSGGKKVIILDEGQKLTEQAQSVLLKPLEDDTGAIWILCTTDPHRLLPALKNRCLSFYLKGLDRHEIEELVVRGLAAVQKTDNDKALYAAIMAADLSSPRDILNSVERFAAGMSPSGAAQIQEDTETDFFKIAKFVAAGNWEDARSILVRVKPADAVALRGMVGSYFKTALIGSVAGDRSDLYAKCLRSASAYSELFQTGASLGLVCAWLYECCRILQKAKQEKKNATEKNTPL